MQIDLFQDSVPNGARFNDFQDQLSMENEFDLPHPYNQNESEERRQPQQDTNLSEQISLSAKKDKWIQKKKPVHKRKVIEKKKPIKKSMAGQYKKNICGYVTKKILREFTSPDYKTRVEKLCLQNRVNYETAQRLYSGKIERVTGPSHLPDLFSWKAQQKGISMAFLQFFKWFLKERYVRHLFEEGKMEQKNTYIQYKNRELIPMISQIEKSLQLEEHQLFSLSTMSSF